MAGEEKQDQSVLADLGTRIGKRAEALRVSQGITKAKLAENSEMDPSTLLPGMQREAVTTLEKALTDKTPRRPSKTPVTSRKRAARNHANADA